MFCPKCATQNLDGASFCRSCGANISLVPQALAGQVPQAQAEDSVLEGQRRRKHSRELTLEQSFKNIFMGVAFLFVAIILARTIGRGWWFWMLLPAFSMVGTGIAQFIRLKESERRSSHALPPVVNTFPNRPGVAPAQGLSPRNTGELRPPVASVTEGTTRHLGVEAAPTRQLDAEEK